MEITHTYQIRELEQLNDDSGTVCNVWFKITSTDGTHMIDSDERVELNTNNIENFISYEDLTEEIVLSWIEASEEAERSRTGHIGWIEYTRNPPKPRTVVKGLPW